MQPLLLKSTVLVPMTRSINLGWHVNSGVVMEKELDQICSVMKTSIAKGMKTTLQRKQKIIIVHFIESPYKNLITDIRIHSFL